MLEKAGADILFSEHRDMRHVQQLLILSCQIKDALERRQFSIDFAVGHGPLARWITLAKRFEPDGSRLPMSDEGSNVCRADCCQAPIAEERPQMFANTALQLIE
jgi:hypothetical protein